MKKYNVVIIGRPNVGKSSLFNRLLKRRHAITHDKAGTTRDFISAKYFFNDKFVELYDTAGILKDKGSVLPEASLKKVKEAISLSDLLIFVVDGNVLPTQADNQVMEMIRKSQKRSLLAIDKLDNGGNEEIYSQYKRFGVNNIFPISVIHNLGLSELQEAIFREAPKGDALSGTDTVKVAIIGKPNVGKSSLLNAISKKERSIVSDIPGTTRDVISEDVLLDESTYQLSDTAGARKPGKIGKAYLSGEPVEKYAYLRTEKEIDSSDIVLLVLDAAEKISAQDLHIAGLAKEKGKGIILVINKWDLVKEMTQEDFLNILRRRFSFMVWVPAIFVSAKTGRNLEEIFPLVKKVHNSQIQSISTSKLNRIMEDFIIHNPPKGLKNLKPKVFFISQTETKPPTFKITAKHYAFVHFSWKRSFENELRRHFDFTGTPIKIFFTSK